MIVDLFARWRGRFRAGEAAQGVAKPARGPREIAYVDDEAAKRSPRRVLVSALGADVPRREEQMESVAALVLKRGLTPIGVGSHLSLPFLVGATFPVEQLPLRADLGSLSTTEYEGYLARRFELILGKWEIGEEITLGLDFPAFLAAETGAEATA